MKLILILENDIYHILFMQRKHAHWFTVWIMQSSENGTLVNSPLHFHTVHFHIQFKYPHVPATNRLFWKIPDFLFIFICIEDRALELVDPCSNCIIVKWPMRIRRQAAAVLMMKLSMSWKLASTNAVICWNKVHRIMHRPAVYWA